MTVKITGISAGEAGVDYLLRGEGCARHVAAEDYYLKGGQVGVEAERPVGYWLGDGVAQLGLIEGAGVAEADVRAVFGKLADPRAYAAQMAAAQGRIASRLAAEPDADAGRWAAIAAEEYGAAAGAARLGNAPRRFVSLADRVAVRLEAEPLADEVRRAQIRAEERAATRKAVGYFDITYSAPKSVSLYHAGLLAAGRGEDAATVEAGHRVGVAAAMEYLQAEAGYARAGHHGRAVGDRASVGRYVDAHAWVGAEFAHWTNRDGDPQLHSHVAVLNRVRTVDADGSVRWRTLDSRSMARARRGADAVYARVMEAHITGALPVVFATRPDGKAREIRGISEAERAAFSTRRAVVTAGVEAWAAEFEARTGHAPGKYLRAKMAEAIVLDSRAGKEAPASGEELAERYEVRAQARLGESMAGLAERAEAAGVAVRREWAAVGGQRIDREQVIGAAVAEVQARRSTWTRADLMASIATSLPALDREVSPEVTAALIGELADEALSGRCVVLADRDQVVQVAGLELVSVPEELRRADGRSMFRPGRDERYATVGHLSDEERLITAAKTSRVDLAVPVSRVEAAIAAAGLEGDQAEVARGVLSSGRRMDVVIGPAGAGKSYTMGVITRTWQREMGGRVIGLGPSQAAAEVLGECGVAHVANTARFLGWVDGTTTMISVGRELAQLRHGDLVIVDEAGMTSTPHLARIEEACRQAGAKMMLTGDYAQLEAVEAGGGLRMLTCNAPYLELETVRRFRDADGQVRTWEAEASLRLRDGDLDALGAYDTHGRIRGGTLEQMSAAARRSYVADTLAGRPAVLVTATNEQAEALNAEIRAELVRLGVIERSGVVVLGGNVAGVGDLIQARRNAPELLDDEGRFVVNRRLYRVQEAHSDGSLTVRHITGTADGVEQYGGVVCLPADYVGEQVALGYAGTVHAAQGRTVARSYLLADAALSRAALYVAMTRGTELNIAYVVTQRQADEHQIEGLDTTPTAVLAEVMEAEAAETAATDWLREELDYMGSLAANGPIWEALVTADAYQRYERALAGLVDAEACARVQADDPSSLYRWLREAELGGHDPRAILAEAIGTGELGDARNLDALLYWRVEQVLDGRQPERVVTGASYRERTLDIAGPRGEYLSELAEVMDARRLALGERAAQEPPAWAERLGEVPEDALARAEWKTRAGTVAAYRERYGIAEEAGGLGAAPAAGMVEQYAEWRAAHDALGIDERTRRISEASEAQLREDLAVYEREQAWAPAYVADQLREAHLAHQDYRERAELAAAQARVAADELERESLTSLAEAYETLNEALGERVETLEEIHTAHHAWRVETTAVREAAIAARAELDRRTEAGQARERAREQAQPERDAQRKPAHEAQATQEPAAEFDQGVEHMQAIEMASAARLDRLALVEPAGGVDQGREEPQEELDLAAEVERARAAVSEIEARRGAREAVRVAEEELAREAGYLARDRAFEIELAQAEAMTPEIDWGGER